MIVNYYLKTNKLDLSNILAKHVLGKKRRRDHDSEKDHHSKGDESSTVEQTATLLKRKMAKHTMKAKIRAVKLNDKQPGGDKSGPMCHHCLKWGHRKAECSLPTNTVNQALDRKAMETSKTYFTRRAADGTKVMYEGVPISDREARHDYNIPVGHTLISTERFHELREGHYQSGYARRATTTTIPDPKFRVWTPPSSGAS